MDELPRGAHCRICGSREQNRLDHLICFDSFDKLIRPCECRGDFAYAHASCLANWLETTKHEYCDICRYKYNITYVDRPLFDWIFETGQLGNSLRIIFLSIFIYYISALGLLVCRSSLTRSALDVAVLASSWIIIVFCSLCLMIYFYHRVKVFRGWRILNRRVTITENTKPQLDARVKPRDVLKSSGVKF